MEQTLIRLFLKQYRFDIPARKKFPCEIEAGMDPSVENPAEVLEQPSLMSVLDSSFYKNDTSPISAIKCASLNFQGKELGNLPLHQNI